MAIVSYTKFKTAIKSERSRKKNQIRSTDPITKHRLIALTHYIITVVNFLIECNKENVGNIYNTFKIALFQYYIIHAVILVKWLKFQKLIS